jgi:hypothetical protein
MHSITRSDLTFQPCPHTQCAITCLADVRGKGGGNEDEAAAKTAEFIDQHLKSGWEAAGVLHDSLDHETGSVQIVQFLEDLKDRSNTQSNTQDTVKKLVDAWNFLDGAGITSVDEAIIDLVQTLAIPQAACSVISPPPPSHGLLILVEGRMSGRVQRPRT